MIPVFVSALLDRHQRSVLVERSYSGDLIPHEQAASA